MGGDHNATWLNCGIYDKPVPSEYAVHNLEHGAVWITYQPSMPNSEVAGLRVFVERQSSLPPGGQRGSRYMDLTPYPGLPAPVVASSWGFQLRLTSPTDPRLQEFVNKFRASKTYTPEYGGECTGGIGTPLESRHPGEVADHYPARAVRMLRRNIRPAATVAPASQVRAISSGPPLLKS